MPTKWEKVEIIGSREEGGLFPHIPVLVNEVLAALRCRAGGCYVDCTVGQGGLAYRILEAGGRVIGLDRDADAIATSRRRLKEFDGSVHLMHGHFNELKRHLADAGVAAVDGVVFDLGVSSAQLDDPQRGFSFQVEGPLDMRMDRSEGVTAEHILGERSEADLARLIYEYGEERFARRIARAIVQSRARGPVRTTSSLVSIVAGAVPAPYRHGRIHFATRTFQALRIAVNAELDGLEGALRDAADVLAPGARLCVISFHSLEDRIVKRTFRALAGGATPSLAIVTKKPIIPTEEEARLNRRARSAKLRVAERLPLGRCA